MLDHAASSRTERTRAPSPSVPHTINLRIDPVEAASHNRIDLRDNIRAAIRHTDSLAPADAALIRAIYHHGVRIREFALATCQPESSLRRRLDRLLKRTGSPLFAFVIRHSRHWPADRRQIACAVILRAETIQSVARRTGLTLHAVRLQLLCIRNLFDESLKPD